MRRLTRSSWFERSAICGALAALMLAAGCGKPSAPPEQFIGTWISAPKGERLRLGAFPTLTLAPDGTGNYTQYPDPHVRGVSWVLRGDKLVLADRDGSGSVTYSYRFKGRDELVIVMEGGESVFKRYAESKPSTPLRPGSREVGESKSRK